MKNSTLQNSGCKAAHQNDLASISLKTKAAHQVKQTFKKAFLCFCAMVLATSMCPAPSLAYATATNNTHINTPEANTENQNASASNTENGTHDNDNNNATNNETTSQTSPQPDCPNSWRYVNGVRIWNTNSDATNSQNQTSNLAEASTPENTLSDTWSDFEGNESYPRGVDVSQWQGEIDWERARNAGVQFAIIRCGWGNDDESQDDSYWHRNVSECERLGIPYGVYIYSYAHSTGEAQSEANHVTRLLQGHSPQYPVYYDLEESDLANEESSQLLADMSKTFCNAISAAGYTPGIYSNLSWRTNYLTDPCFDSWDMWIAQWNSTCTYSGDYHLWQCSSSGDVDGIDGRVDIDIDYQTRKYTLPADAFDTIFNSNYYLANNPDVVAAFGYDENQAIYHFKTYGMREGRVAAPTFDVTYYKNNYSDLRNAFGDDLTAYYNHFLSNGINEMRQGSAEFNPKIYLRNYADLRDAFDKSYILYVRHYVNNGKNEGRNAASLISGGLSDEQYNNWNDGNNIQPNVSIAEADNNSIRVTITYNSGEKSVASNVEVPVWTLKNGQDDLVWYNAEKQGDKSWVCNIDMSRHNYELSEYIVHVYQSLRGKERELIAQKSTTPTVKETTVYRLYNHITSEHLFTTNYQEYEMLVNYDWIQEGVGWRSYNIGKPVYRLYNPVLGHLYTTSTEEIAFLVGIGSYSGEGWSYEGVSFISTDGVDGAQPVKRLYNSGFSGISAPGQHHYTLSSHEYDTLIAYHGWSGEDIAFYALS